MTKPPYRAAVSLVIYNEEQFIRKTLFSISKCLIGIDFIHILDGSWHGSGGQGNSNDKTKQEVGVAGKFIEESTGIDVDFVQQDKIFRTQGDKRNEAMRLCEIKMKKIDADARWYHIIMDGDEVIKFPNGLFDLNLIKRKSGVDHLWPKIGAINTFASGSSLDMWTPRFIPAFQEIHWHTDQRMVWHDKDCNVIANYNLDVRDLKDCELLTAFFIVNYWNKRDISRSLMKLAYNTVTFPNKPVGCNYNNTFNLIPKL